MLKGVMEGREQKAMPLTMSSLNIYNVKDNIEYQTFVLIFECFNDELRNDSRN